MSDKLKPPQKAPFHGIEVINGQEVIIPPHNRVSSTGQTLSEVCPSTKGVIVFFGGVPVVIPKARCKERENQKCFFFYE
jgi:hypothetical protein